MDAWFGIAAILVGLASCFYGFTLFRILLILAGLIEGYVFGHAFAVGPITHRAISIRIQSGNSVAHCSISALGEKH